MPAPNKTITKIIAMFLYKRNFPFDGSLVSGAGDDSSFPFLRISPLILELYE
jgi:hypothetical protein